MNKQTIIPTKTNRIFYFDALRTIAILAVIIFHLYTACDTVVLKQYATIPQWNG